MDSVLIVFADSSLGGTSRSALVMGKAWRLAGYEVTFSPQKGIHTGRLDEFLQVGRVRGPEFTKADSGFTVLHFHHGAVDPFTAACFARLVEVVDPYSAPLLLTHNVFGTPFKGFRDWPGRHVTGLLSAWGEAQYLRSSAWRRQDAEIARIPNPQDMSEFRVPTAVERSQARSTLGLHTDERLILRVGSPHVEKWHPIYKRLVDQSHGQKIVLVGVPDGLLKEEQSSPTNVSLMNAGFHADELRTYYWAADVFAHAAQRGESFGNVLLEAAACGLPVAYFAREYRDNAPWEFAALDLNVNYYRTSSSWLEAVLSGQLRPDEDRARLTFERIEQLYSIRATAGILSRTVSSVDRRTDSLELPRTSWRIWLLHNPLIAVIKRLKNSLLRRS